MDKAHTHTLIDQHTGEVAFKIFKFNDLNHFGHIQRKNCYSLLLLQTGEAMLKVDITEYLIGPATLICCSPYQPHMLTSVKPSSGCVLYFHPDFFCTYKHQNEIATEGVLFHNSYQAPFFHLTQTQNLLDILARMAQELTEDHLAQHEVLVAYLKIFLIEAVRQKQKYDQTTRLKSVNDQPEMIQNLVNAIEHHFCEKHSPLAYADMLCTTPKTLGRIVKKYFNKTLTDLITNRIIIEAKRELYLTAKSVKQISFSLGYQDAFYFSRLFKKRVGVSPEVYRKTVGFAKLQKGQ
ncbi:MAG: helix-turn-helix domain-containing protein [Thermonemataceae bacterium]